MTDRQTTIVYVAAIAVAGIVAVPVLKQGVTNGLTAVGNAAAKDVTALGVGGGIALASLLLPPPVDILGIIAGGVVAGLIAFSSSPASTTVAGGPGLGIDPIIPGGPLNGPVIYNGAET